MAQNNGRGTRCGRKTTNEATVHRSAGRISRSVMTSDRFRLPGPIREAARRGQSLPGHDEPQQPKPSLQATFRDVEHREWDLPHTTASTTCRGSRPDHTLGRAADGMGFGRSGPHDPLRDFP